MLHLLVIKKSKNLTFLIVVLVKQEVNCILTTHHNSELARLLIQGLKRNESLQSVFLRNNNLGDKIGAAIMYAVMENESLRVLDMAQNKLSVNWNDEILVNKTLGGMCNSLTRANEKQ